MAVRALHNQLKTSRTLAGEREGGEGTTHFFAVKHSGDARAQGGGRDRALATSAV